MYSFVGDFSCKIDAKGRFSLPSVFRKIAVKYSIDSFVIRKSIYASCLDIFPFQTWKEQTSFFRNKLNIYNQEQAKLMREFFRGTIEVSLDANGRLLLPKRMLTLINAQQVIILAGQDFKIEIWDKPTYETGALPADELMKLTQKVLGSDE